VPAGLFWPSVCPSDISVFLPVRTSGCSSFISVVNSGSAVIAISSTSFSFIILAATVSGFSSDASSMEGSGIQCASSESIGSDGLSGDLVCSWYCEKMCSGLPPSKFCTCFSSFCFNFTSSSDGYFSFSGSVHFSCVTAVSPTTLPRFGTV